MLADPGTPGRCSARWSCLLVDSPVRSDGQRAVLCASVLVRCQEAAVREAARMPGQSLARANWQRGRETPRVPGPRVQVNLTSPSRAWGSLLRVQCCVCTGSYQGLSDSQQILTEVPQRPLGAQWEGATSPVMGFVPLIPPAGLPGAGAGGFLAQWWDCSPWG